MRRWLVVWLWLFVWAGAGCSRPSQQSAIETAVAATLTARPAATAAAFRLSVTPWPTPGRANALSAAATPAPPSRPTATAAPRPTASPRAFADIRANCLSWTEAKAHEGQTQCVCGPVVEATYAARSNGAPTFLNLGGKATDLDRFTVVIWGDQRPNFDPPPEQAYRGKTICVTGRIKLYKGVAEIQISSPAEVATE